MEWWAGIRQRVLVVRGSQAYECTSLIITTDLTLVAWAELLGNERLAYLVHILEASGASYRLAE
jgi:hypothetical protein